LGTSLIFSQQIMDYIDSLPNLESTENFNLLFDVEQLKKIFWNSFITYFTTKSPLEKSKAQLKCNYLNRHFGSDIPLNPNISIFNAPHGFYGIFISREAKLGTGCTIFQHVTIGSNTLLDSKNSGTPTIGNNVYIGAGAKIIGNVTIGDNVRIGAGCTVTRDIPDNCTVAQGAPFILPKDKPQDNRWLTLPDYHKMKSSNNALPPSTTNFSSVNARKVQEDNIYRTASKMTLKNYKNAFRILFCGDLILLEDQVKRAFDGKNYNFDEMFEFTKEYISSADFSIGVLEGPLGGNANLYSQSNYDDGKTLRLNFPDEFADAIKKAGFALVTTANNHLLDMGIDGAKRTIKVLKEKNIDFIGSYQSAEDKANSRVKIVEKNGIKMVFLAYTAFINGFEIRQLMSKELSYLTSLISHHEIPEFESILATVYNDFELAKSYKPDLIIVLPHWGTQFADEPNYYQKFWREIFLSLGADIILGCHTHSVQPVKIETVDGRQTYTLYCPGNYANIYREYNGDASLMAEVYIDRDTKKVIGGSIIPMWTRSTLQGNYRPLPIYDILNDDKLRRQVSTFELEKISYVLRHITRVVLGTELDEILIQKRYLFDEAGFKRKKVSPLQIDDTISKGKFFQSLKTAQNVCFVGDSVTQGTKNGGVPWYEPLEGFISGKIFNASFGGATIKVLIREEILSKIVAIPADLFVVAIGTNDVRYRNESICAMTPEEYISCLQVLREAILKNNPAAKFIFIAPWISTDGDKVSALRYYDKIKMNNLYTDALKIFCETSGDIFINPNPYIEAVLDCRPHKDYLKDWIHPIAGKGVILYSEAVLKA